MKKFAGLIVCLLIILSSTAFANKAIQVVVGALKQVAAETTLVADPDALKQIMLVQTPEITYQGGVISYKPNFAYISGTSNPISAPSAYCGLFISVKDAAGEKRYLLTLNEPLFLINNQPPTEKVLFNPDGAADINVGLNTKLAEVIRPGTKIKIGQYIVGGGTSATLSNTYNYSGDAFVGPGTLGIASNFDLGETYDTLKAKVAFKLSKAEITPTLVRW